MSAASVSVHARPVGLRALVRRHPLATYFVLAYAVSWTGILLVAAPGGIPAAADAVAALLPLVLLAMVAGPSLASPLLTALVDGRDGLRALLARLTRWRVAPEWYAVALLTAPALILAALGTATCSAGSTPSRGMVASPTPRRCRSWGAVRPPSTTSAATSPVGMRASGSASPT